MKRLLQYNVGQISCGSAHTIVLTDEPTVHLFAFGLNDKGQLGFK